MFMTETVTPGGELLGKPGHLIRRAQQVHNVLWTTSVSRDVTPTQFSVLSVVASHPSGDQNALARMASLDTSTIGAVVNRLIERGWLAAGKDPGDRRRNLLTLTSEGERLHAEISELAAAMTDRMVAGLSQEDQEELLRLLQRLVAHGEELRSQA